jgi:hypothetical protein
LASIHKKGEFFCAYLKRWKWQGENIINLPYNYPFIAREFCSVEGCCETYYLLQKEHCMHMDLICYLASIYCGVLVEWCQMINVCFNVNHPMVGDHEFALITKIHHHPSQSFWLLQLMCFLRFI